jgi:polyisoprenoid-binding protein YceI
MKKSLVLAALLLVATGVFAQSTWMFDAPHSSVNFAISHLSVSETTGKFKKFDGKIVSNADDFSGSQIDFTIDVNSVNTEDEKRDGHLKSADYFDAAKFPTITFKSKSMTKIEGNKYKLVGDITMHGVTKTVELMAELNRKDFGIAEKTPGAIVGEEVMLSCSVEIVKS